MRNELLFGIGGAILGFGLGYITKHFLTKKEEKKRKEKIIEDAINDVLAESGLTREEIEKPEDGGEESEEEKTNFEKRREEIKEKLERSWSITTNYAECYTKKGTAQNGEGVPVMKLSDEELDALVSDYLGEESSEDEEPDERDEDPEDVHMDWEAIDFHEKNKDRKPRIISLDDWMNAPEFLEKQKLMYYVYSNDLVDEEGEILNATEEELLIGDALTKYDFVDNDEEVIYVMCFAADKIFEIEKVYSEL